MKKNLVLVLALFFVLASVACNSGPAASTPGTTSQTQGSVQTTEATTVDNSTPSSITLFFPWDPESAGVTDRLWFEQINKKWSAMHPDIELVMEGAPNQGLEMLQTRLAAGTMGDVFVHQTRLAAFAQAGYLMDISDQPWVERMVDGVKPDCIWNDKVWAAPLDCNGWGVYYMKDIYEGELGLGIPNDFDEFLDICQKIKDAGYDPLIAGGSEGWPFQGLFLSFTSFLYGQNENFHIDLYNGDASLAGPEMFELFSAIQELYDRGFFSDGCMSFDMPQTRQYMADGKAVIGFGCPGVITPLEQEENGSYDLGYFYIPDRQGYNCVPVIACWVISINADYKYGSTLGIDLLNCMIDDESLHARHDNVTPSSFSDLSMTYDTTGGQAYQDAFDKGPVVLQCTSWLPSSIFNQYQQIVSSIISGSGFTQEMLDNMEATYRADIKNVNVLQP